MFNIGPMEMLVLAAVALMVFGPDKLPQLAKDAGRMLRTLRDLAQGARSQLTDELGPEFTNFDLNSLNPKTAIRNALLGDDDLSSLNPKDALSRALRGDDEPASPQPPAQPAVAATLPLEAASPPADQASERTPQAPAALGQPAPYDLDAT